MPIAFTCNQDLFNSIKFEYNIKICIIDFYNKT